MNQRKITLLVFLLVVSLKNISGNTNPVKDFCQKNSIHQKSVIIALSLGDCAVCYTPPDELLDRIRKTNSEIPVYVVTDEDMAEGEKKIFKGKFGAYANSLVFMTDRPTYRYMLSEKSGIPSVCCVSENGDVLVFKHLKHEDLQELFNVISPDPEAFLINKTELKSNYISPKKHDGAMFMHNSVYLFHMGANVIAKYNMRGDIVKNLSIDSLPVDYLQLARQLFPEKVFKSSEENYRVNHPKRSRLIRAINVIKMGNDTLCVQMEITARGDTVFNNKPTKYERSYACLFLLDTELNYLGTRPFLSLYDACHVNFYMRGAYLNNKFYLGRFDTLLKQSVMAEYEMKNSTLVLKKQFIMPKEEERVKGTMPMIPSICTSRNNIYISYFKPTKGVITSMKTHKLNKANDTFNEEMAVDAFWAQMYATKKGNYVLWTVDKDRKSIVKIHNKNTKQITDSKEKLSASGGAKTQNTDHLFFVFDGQLQEYAYIE